MNPWQPFKIVQLRLHWMPLPSTASQEKYVFAHLCTARSSAHPQGHTATPTARFPHTATAKTSVVPAQTHTHTHMHTLCAETLAA